MHQEHQHVLQLKIMYLKTTKQKRMVELFIVILSILLLSTIQHSKKIYVKLEHVILNQQHQYFFIVFS
jgi:hypothetical protein